MILRQDGSPLHGVLGQICFCPVDPTNPNNNGPWERGELPGLRLAGGIRPDGTFELWSLVQNKGNEPINYKVFFLEAESEKSGRSPIPGRYMAYDQSPWIVQMLPGGTSKFELQIE
jgi:hypothetical protein